MALIHKQTQIADYRPTVTGRKVRYVFSTPDVDREGDRLLDWQLDAFRRSPVILLAHNYGSLPVARCTSITWEPDQELSGTVEFADGSINPEAERAFQLVQAGYMRACSVGLRPIKAPVANQFGGYDYPLSELLEVSLVSVPAHPGALAKSLNHDAAQPISAKDLENITEAARVVELCRESGSWDTLQEFLKGLAKVDERIFTAICGAIGEVYTPAKSADLFDDLTPEEEQAAINRAAEFFAQWATGGLPGNF
jgi:HK97 family phage prohead protease